METAAAEVHDWLESSFPFATVEKNYFGDMFKVRATVGEIEKAFSTTLGMVHHVYDLAAPSIKSIKPLTIPNHLHEKIQLISLNTPPSHGLKVRGHHN